MSEDDSDDGMRDRLPSLAELADAATREERLADLHQIIEESLGSHDAARVQAALTDGWEAAGVRPRPPGVTRFSDVTPKAVQWIWPGRIPLGKLTMLDGDSGQGKSTICVDLAARISRGDEMPDGVESDLGGPRGVTFLVNEEDDLADTIRPRLDAADANVDRINALRYVEPERTTDNPRRPSLHDLDEIEAAIRDVNAALLVVDPLLRFLGQDVDSNRFKDILQELAPVRERCRKLDVSLLGVRHLNKSDLSKAQYRGMGSIGLTAAPRSVLLVGPDPQDPEGETKVLASVEVNNAPEPSSIAYRLEGVEHAKAERTSRVRWLEEASHAADDLLQGRSSEELSAREEAERFLVVHLAGEPLPSDQIRDRADAAEIAWRTIRRAKDSLGIEARPQGFGEDCTWRWHLPEPDTLPARVRDLAESGD